MRRGTIKAFRKYLNAKHRFDVANWRHNKFRQLTREYGDYLYYQDRAIFDLLLQDALGGDSRFADFTAP
jgi:hypothetical protein